MGEDEDADETMDSTTEEGVIRRGLSILDSTVGDSTIGDSTLDTSELETSAADTPAKPIKVDKKTPVKPAKAEESPAKPAKANGTPAKPVKVETPAKEVGDK